MFEQSFPHQQSAGQNNREKPRLQQQNWGNTSLLLTFRAFLNVCPLTCRPARWWPAGSALTSSDPLVWKMNKNRRNQPEKQQHPLNLSMTSDEKTTTTKPSQTLFPNLSAPVNLLSWRRQCYQGLLLLLTAWSIDAPTFVTCVCVCVCLLVDNGGHGDLQKLLLQRDEGQEAGVEEAQQLQHSGEAEQHRDTRVLPERRHTPVI